MLQYLVVYGTEAGVDNRYVNDTVRQTLSSVDARWQAGGESQDVLSQDLAV